MKIGADYSTIEEVSARLIEASDRLGELTGAVAKARQIREYDSDRRKRALSCAVRDFLNEGDSATAAEHKARASESYAELMKATARDLITAEQTIAEWEAVKCRWESARSLLSVQKQILGNL
jgi:hypothetical protein